MSRIQDRYSGEFSQKVDSSDAMKAFREGKFISPLGVEGLHQIGNKVSNLRLYRDLGVRYATLTHNCHNNFADAALLGMNPEIAKPKWGGVSPLGQRLVHEMNRIGMIVDLAHVRYATSDANPRVGKTDKLAVTILCAMCLAAREIGRVPLLLLSTRTPPLTPSALILATSRTTSSSLSSVVTRSSW